MGPLKRSKDITGQTDVTAVLQVRSAQNQDECLVRMRNGLTTWISECKVPPAVLEAYRSSKPVDLQNQEANMGDLNKQKGENSGADSAENKSKQKIKLQAPNLRKKSLRSQSVIEISEGQDSFMNESSSEEQAKQKVEEAKAKKQPGKKGPKNKGSQRQAESKNEDNSQFIELVADIEGSSDDESSLDDSDESRRYFKGKQPKTKVTKSKSKKLIKKSKRDQKNIDEENIIDKRNRTNEKKNYKEVNDPKSAAQKNKINFPAVTKQFTKNAYIQSLLVNVVMESGMSGPYKYYLVRLRNDDLVYIREKDMRLYFPRKLHEYYQRVLNKVAKSTQKLNFAL